MQQHTPEEYKQLLTEVIKKQIVILGPSITLTKARNVAGLEVADDGTVVKVSGSPQEVTQALIEQFMELSGMIVKKTMEPLLGILPDGVAEHLAGAQANNQPPVPPTPPTQQQPPTGQVIQNMQQSK